MLLDGKVLARMPEEEWASLIEEGKRRVEEQRPPGYLDAVKGDLYPEGPAGDFLVYWQASLEAKRRGLDLVIVTGDKKEDWWRRHHSVLIGATSGDGQGVLRSDRWPAAPAPTTADPSPPVRRPRRQREPGLTGGLRAGSGTIFVPVGIWTEEAVAELLHRLDAEGAVQAG